MEHISEVLESMRAELAKRRDSEIMEASNCAGQYVTDHHNKEAFRQIEREVNKLARAWDRMIDKLEKWSLEADKIERSCENFYGD